MAEKVRQQGSKSMNEPRNTEEHALRHMLTDFDETARLKMLSNEELVMECLSLETDCPVIDEMCDRLFPGWENEGH